MYIVHVDLVLWYLPPLDEIGGGIRVHRTFELPFPPSESISVFSKHWEGHDDPVGYPLKEITWDLDRHCFLAETHMSATGLPIAVIPLEIRSLLDQGWTYGSCTDAYGPEPRGRKRSKLRSLAIGDWDDEEVEQWETARPKARPKEFKTVLQSLVATMAQLHNNCSVAYAMLKTGGYVAIPKETPHTDWSAFQRKFAAAMKDFESMTFEQQWDWGERIQRRYPRLIDVIEAIP